METIFQYSQTGSAIVFPVIAAPAQSPGVGAYAVESISIDNGTEATLYLAQNSAGATKSGCFATIGPYQQRTYPIPNWNSLVVASDGSTILATDKLTVLAFDGPMPASASAHSSNVHTPQVSLGTIPIQNHGNLNIPPETSSLIVSAPSLNPATVVISGNTSNTKYMNTTIPAGQQRYCIVSAVDDPVCDISVTTSPVDVTAVQGIIPAGAALSVVTAGGGATGSNAVGEAYEFGTSQNAVMATDRPLDTWFLQAGPLGSGGGGISLTQAAPGAGKRHVVSSIFGALNNEGGTADAKTLTITWGAGSSLFATDLNVSATNGDHCIVSMSDIRWRGDDNHNVTVVMNAPASSNFQSVLVSGYTIRNPNS